MYYVYIPRHSSNSNATLWCNLSIPLLSYLVCFLSARPCICLSILLLAPAVPCVMGRSVKMGNVLPVLKTHRLKKEETSHDKLSLMKKMSDLQDVLERQGGGSDSSAAPKSSTMLSAMTQLRVLNISKRGKAVSHLFVCEIYGPEQDQQGPKWTNQRSQEASFHHQVNTRFLVILSSP